MRAVLEAPGFVAGLDDLAVVGKTVEQRRRHLGIAEDGGPFAERKVAHKRRDLRLDPGQQFAGSAEHPGCRVDQLAGEHADQHAGHCVLWVLVA